MKKRVVQGVFVICLLCMTACQEIKISIEAPHADQIGSETQLPSILMSETATPVVMPTKTLTQKPTNIPTLLPTATPNQKIYFQDEFDPYSILLSWEDLPLDVYFSGGHLKMYDVSYLYNPGNLLGTAYVREFFSYPHDLYFTEILIRSPVKITSEMLRAGFYGDSINPVEDSYQVGELSLAGERQDEKHTFAYRFAEGNTMVVLALQGSHAYASFENIVTMAQNIRDRFPQDFFVNAGLPIMSQELKPDLYAHYFQDLALVDCTLEHKETDVFMFGDQGFCFRADAHDLILNLKTGIYSTRYNKLFYIKFFEPFTHLGEYTDFIKHPVWDFGWQHLPEGEYEVWFWVDDQLVTKLPFSYKPNS